MNCLICDTKIIDKTKNVDHLYFGKKSEILNCKNCDYSFFLKAIEDENHDKNFSSYYLNSNTFNPSIQTIPNLFEPIGIRNFANISLIKVFKFLKKKMNILEIGPGYPGMLYIFKTIMSGENKNEKERGSNFFSIENDTESLKKLDKLDIKNICEYFPSKECNKYQNYFDIIITINSFYYFRNPKESLKLILSMLKKDGILYLDILSDKMMHEDYFKSNPLSHIYSKKSLKKLAKIVGLEIVFLEYSSKNNTPKLYSERIRKIDKSIIKKIFNRLLKNFGFVPSKEIENHLFYSEDFDQTASEIDAGRIRAIFRKN